MEKGKRKSKEKGKAGPPSIKPIGKEDYYRRSSEFRIWLKRRKNMYMEDLHSTELKKIFNDEFCKKWNDGKLSAKYYKYESAKDDVSLKNRTKHEWSFAKNLDSYELGTLRGEVRKASNTSSMFEDNEKDHEQTQTFGRKLPAKDVFEIEEERRMEQERLKYDRKTHRKLNRDTMDELVPRPDNARAARLDKRRTMNVSRNEAENEKYEPIEREIFENDSFQALKRGEERRKDLERARKMDRAKELQERLEKRERDSFRRISKMRSAGFQKASEI